MTKNEFALVWTSYDRMLVDGHCPIVLSNGSVSLPEEVDDYFNSDQLELVRFIALLGHTLRNRNAFRVMILHDLFDCFLQE